MKAARSSSAAASGPAGLQFQLLGRLEAYRDGVQVDLGPRKQRAVLALLLLNANRVVSTERLIDDLWGDSPPSTARAALQVYIAGLRKALANDGAALRTRPPGYVLELESGALDVDRFEQLRAEARDSSDNERRAALLGQALLLWRDEPLAELRAEPFSAAAAAQLEELRLSALEERIDADLALGRHAALVSELDALVAEHPYRERLRAQLMLALYRSGRQAEALDAYQAGRRVLRDELGLEPGAELRELEAAILRQDEALLPEASTAARESGLVARASLSRARLLAILTVVALAAVAAVAVLLARGEPAPVDVPPNSLAVIDPDTRNVVDAVPVGNRPGPVAAGAGSVWVGNVEDKTLSRIDPAGRRTVRTVPLEATPTALAVGAGAVWVAYGLRGQVARVDPQYYAKETIDVTGKPLYFPSAGVAVGAGSVWAVFGDSTLARIDPVPLRKTGSTLAGNGPAGIVADDRAIWVSNAGDSTVQRFDTATFDKGPLDEPRSVSATPSGIATGEGSVWVACAGDDVVVRIDPTTKAVRQIPVGDGPTAVAVGAGAVWVANTPAGTVSRIDPSTNEVTTTIELDVAPAGIAIADGLVWVAAQPR